MKRNGKRLAGLLLSAAVLLGGLCLPASAQDAQTPEQESLALAQERLGYLDALGILDQDSAVDQLKAGVKRGDFARMMAIAGGRGTGDAAAGTFADVTAADPNAGYINALAAAGIVSGFSSGTFLPEQEITTEEAQVLCIRILGYGYRAEDRGGYPAGYAQVARQLELTQAAPFSDTVMLTLADAVNLIFQTLDTTLVDQTVYGNDPAYQLDDQVTLAYRVFQVIHHQGIMDAVDITALKGANPVGSYRCSIEGQIVETGDLEVWDCLGYAVDAYCRYDSREHTETLLLVEKDSRNKETSVSIQDITQIGGGIVTYQGVNDLRSRKAKFSAMAAVVYNGASTQQPFTMDLLTDGALVLDPEEQLPAEGTVRLLDNDGDGLADVVFVDAYTNIVVNAADPQTHQVYDRYQKITQGITLDVTVDEPYTLLYIKENGVWTETANTSVQRGTVLSVYQSLTDADQILWRVYASQDKAAGVLSAIQEKDGRHTVTVSGREYSLTQRCWRNESGRLKAGANVTLLLDKEGYVAGVDLVQGIQVGYLTAVSTPQNPFNHAFMLRIYTMDGAFAEYQCADRLKVDDSTYTDFDKVLNILHRGSGEAFQGFSTAYPADAVAQPVRYKLNSKGEISYLDTLYTSSGTLVKAQKKDANGDNVLYMGSGGRSISYRQSGYIFQELFTARGDTPVVKCPMPGEGDTSDEKAYNMTTVNQGFVSNTTCAAVPFYTRDEGIAADYIVSPGGAYTISYDSSVSVVDRVYTSVMDDGSIGHTLALMNGGGISEIKVEDSFDALTAGSIPVKGIEDLMQGDIVRYALDERGRLAKLELAYRVGDVADDSDDAVGVGGPVIKAGYIWEKEEDGFRLLQTNNRSSLTTATATDGNMFTYGLYAGCQYIVLDDTLPANGERLSPGSVQSVLGYDDVGLSACSRVIIHTVSRTPSTVLILRR